MATGGGSRFASFRRPQARYGEEVLFAGWVQLPAALRARNARRS